MKMTERKKTGTMKKKYTKVKKIQKMGTAAFLTGRETEKNEDTEEIPVILADPPWHYKVYSKKGAGRSAESHYPTMETSDIMALPVADIAAEDSALFLWVTFPCLQEGLEVLKAWGFEYKTVAFVWVKQNKKSSSLFWGMGYWTRSNVEMCLLGTRGQT